MCGVSVAAAGEQARAMRAPAVRFAGRGWMAVVYNLNDLAFDDTSDAIEIGAALAFELGSVGGFSA